MAVCVCATGSEVGAGLWQLDALQVIHDTDAELRLQ